jgi:hypothetical protein
MTVVMMLIGIGLGSYLGYARGYRHGQKVTNAWWIEKQSRYYDSYEVEKKRRDRGFNAF